MKRPDLASAVHDHALLVAEYVCGLLKAEERAQVHQLLSRDDHALAQALAWEEDLLALVDALPRAQPTATLRERLQRTLGIGPPPAWQPPPPPQLLRRPSPEPGAMAPPAPKVAIAAGNPPPAAKPRRKADEPAHTAVVQSAAQSEPSSIPAASQAADAGASGTVKKTKRSARRNADGEEERSQRVLLRKLWFWRWIGLCATATAIAGLLLPGDPPPPPVQIVKVAPTRAAILQAPGTSSTPGWTATLDPHGNLQMRPLVHTEVPAGSQALLWTRAENIPEPRLLGRIDPNRPVQVPRAQLGELSDRQILEITLERDEDAAEGVPNGPILFIGQMTVFGSETATTLAEDSSGTGGAITQETHP